MSQPFASGKHAIGICDRCGFQYKLHELQSEVVDLNVTGTLVCPECWDPDQPQLQLGRWPINDPQAIRNPRPPQGLEQSRYGDAIRYDFLTSDDGFTLKVSEFLTVGTVTYNSSSQTIVSNPDNAAGLQYNGVVSPTVSVETSDSDGNPLYDFVRCRVRINPDPDSEQNPVPSPNASYLGAMYWRTESGSYPYSATTDGIPDWNQMGEPYQVLTWDLRGNTDWTGTITGLYWIFFKPLTKSGSYEIDYVRFEKE